MIGNSGDRGSDVPSSPRWSFRTRPLAALYAQIVIAGIPRVVGFVAFRFFRLIYKEFSFGPGARVWGRPLVNMEPGSSISIGRRVYMVSDTGRAGIAISSPCKFRTMPGAHIAIGDEVAMNGTSITCRQRVEIGSGTLIAANVIIMDSDFHPHWPPEDRFLQGGSENDRPVSIGRNVWIGVGAMVLKGAMIGDNTIVGAGSVVTGPIPGDVVVGGVPARVIRQRDASDPSP